MKLQKIAVLITVAAVLLCGCGASGQIDPATENQAETTESATEETTEEETETAENELDKEEGENGTAEETESLFDISTYMEDYAEDCPSTIVTGGEKELPAEVAAKITGDMRSYLNNWVEASGILETATADSDSGEILLLADTGFYRIYGDSSNLYILTDDGKSVVRNGWYSSTGGGFAPEFYEGDMDLDGEPELFMTLVIETGTEYYIERGCIVDRNLEGAYEFYEIQKYWYYQRLLEQASCYLTDEGSIALSVGGEMIGDPVSAERIDGYMDGDSIFVRPTHLNYVEVTNGFVRILCKLSVFADSSVIGTYPYNPAVLTLDYQGAGQFTVKDFSISDRETEDVFDETIQNLPEGKYYKVWDEPDFDHPILILTDEVFEPANYDYAYTPMSCELFIMEEGELVSIGNLGVFGSAFPLRIADGGIYISHSHLVEHYVPDFETHTMRLDFGWYDPVVGPEDVDRSQFADQYVFYDGTNVYETTEEEFMSRLGRVSLLKYMDLKKKL